MTAPCKADVVAADRLLKAAVREALAIYRAPDASPVDVVVVTDMFNTAGTSAALLLGEAVA